MTNFAISIHSDTICPWCYIGLRALQQSIALYQKTYPNGKNDTFTTTWLAYYLNPAAPAGSVPAEERLLHRVGPERITGMRTRLERVGRAHGIDFTFAGRIGRTRDSHRVIAVAGRDKGADVQGRVVEELFGMLFERGGDITSHEDLVAAAVAAGLDGDEVRGWLENGEGGELVDWEAEEARRAGVAGVPRFVVQGIYEIDGADDPGFFMETFIKVKEDEMRSSASRSPGELSRSNAMSLE